MKLLLDPTVWLIILAFPGSRRVAREQAPFLSLYGWSAIAFKGQRIANSVILPCLGLSLWAPSGVLPRTRLGWLLARFVAPAAVTISIAGMLVYRFFPDRTGDVAYAQLALTYLLTISGLVLVIFLRPPVRRFSPTGMDSGERGGDWRPTALVLVLLLLLLVVAPIPLADEVFGLRPLQQTADYLIVGLAVFAWASAAVLLWRLRPPERLWRRFRG